MKDHYFSGVAGFVRDRNLNGDIVKFEMAEVSYTPITFKHGEDTKPLTFYCVCQENDFISIKKKQYAEITNPRSCYLTFNEAKKTAIEALKINIELLKMQIQHFKNTDEETYFQGDK